MTIDLNGRERKLSEIKRFGKVDVMHYRTNDLIHSRRVALIYDHVIDSISSLYEGVSRERGILKSLVHDDPEMKTGDVPGSKKREMGNLEKLFLDLSELEAIDELCELCPVIGGYEYKDLLHSAHFKDNLEAQIISYIDKVDGFCEAYHELRAGNNAFIEPMKHYPSEINSFREKYPGMGELFDSDIALFSRVPRINITETLEKGGLHTPEDIKKRTGIYHYDLWKSITLSGFGIRPLVEVKEDYNVREMEFPIYERNEMFSDGSP